MNTPLISVIIPVYNVEKYLRKCVDSVLAQTYTNLEIILVDDGSTDDSGKICDEYAAKDGRVKVIHKSNGGVSSARNAGLKIATGEYIGFVDGDDYIEPDMYQYLYHLCACYQVSLSVCNCVYITNGSQRIVTSFPTETVWPSSQALANLLAQLFSVNKLFKKKLLEDISFPTDIFLGEDMVFCVQAFDTTGKIAYGPNARYYYVRNLSSVTKQVFNSKKLTYFQAADYVLQYAQRNHLSSLQKKVKEQICYHAVGFLRQIAVNGDADKSVIKNLQQKVRVGITRHLFSRHKLSNKFFALACCIDFDFTAKIYRSIFSK